MQVERKPTAFKGILTILGGGGNAEGGAIYNTDATVTFTGV
ncbi:MAG TPA: hypothetical protein VNA04_09945 [Thermoanaerobaculia bacterium]|nr:hypothetical protein [Thermoanaerobaculia bacterium]